MIPKFKALSFLYLALLLGGGACNRSLPPAPLGPIPSDRQLAWHELEYYAFIHFNMNTFTNREWGLGDESPGQFNPTALDAGQWVRVLKKAGMKGIILTAKHHDGFCLWPTETTEHSVKNSPWRDGKGDLLKEVAEACKAGGLKFGVYLSPWDRNHADYGRPGYVQDFHTQLKELSTQYGPLFEVWFDGANGGSGYYGGARETRKIDNKTYYEWDKAVAIVRELQPDAVIFSDGGPDVRWVGNEEGWANETNWSLMRRDEIYPGWPRYKELRSGHEDGTHWLPAEADVSIRPGWYYHASEDHRVKSVATLLDIYYKSVGRNAALLLNVPVDQRGLIHETDVEKLLALKEQLDKDFATDLAKGVHIEASNVRGGHSDYAAERLIDGNPDTYWATDDGTRQASITLRFEQPTAVNRLLLQERIALGQRIQQFSVSALRDGTWTELDRQTTIGYKRILRFPTVQAEAIRIEILAAKGPPAISGIGLFEAPALLVPPEIYRNREGYVRLQVPDSAVKVHYTLDGSMPVAASPRYSKPFLMEDPGMVRALSVDPRDGRQAEVVSRRFDIAKRDWKVVIPSPVTSNNVTNLIDDNPETFWAPEAAEGEGREVVIDLGREYLLRGFTYWPMQERWSFGIFTAFEFFVSPDARNWRPVASGEFANILNNPVEQRISFAPAKGRFIKLMASKVSGEDQRASYGEIGILTSNP